MDEISELSDFDLVSLCIKSGSKDERPFIELFQRHATFVNRILWRYFPSEQDVEDLTQEVFFKIYRNLAQFESRSSLKTWIFTIATNTAKNEIRNRSRRPDLIDQIHYDTEFLNDRENDLPLIEENPLQQIIEQAYEKLSPVEKEILLLKDKNEMTYKEVAGHLGISESAAKMRVQRSRLAMKKKYQELLNEL